MTLPNTLHILRTTGSAYIRP